MLTQTFISTEPEKLLSKDDTFVVIPLSRKCEPSISGVIDPGTEVLGPEYFSEVWSVQGPVVRGGAAPTYWSKTDDVICVSHWLSKEQCFSLEDSVLDAYLTIFSVLKEHGFFHPFRFWNYLPDINTGVGDEETYKRFCTGRWRAFKKLGVEPEEFPSASALGHHSQGAVVYVFASRSQPVHLKNDRQVNAYDYPRQYGITSPSFTRATSLSLCGGSHLFISGTASIIGHKTVEVGDLERQLEVTASNIEHILSTANPHKRKLSTFKVYLRYASHFDQTLAWLEAHYPDVKKVITLADICRADLLVEIECFCQ